MNRTATVLLVATLCVTGCARIRDSRINPFNWFGGSAPQVTTLDPGYADATDGRVLVDQVTQMEVTRTAYGAIVQAAGLPPTQGWWDAELVADNNGIPVDGVLTYRFVVSQPDGARRVSTPQSREVTAAAALSTVKLAEVSRIVVQGLRNNRASAR